MKLSFSASLLFQALLANASPFLKYKHTSGVSLRVRSPIPFQEPSPNALTSHIVQLQRNSRQIRGSHPPGPLRRQYKRESSSPFSNFGQEYLGAVLQGGELSAEIEIGTQKFNVIFDTGSSDLWVTGEDYTCVSQNFTVQSKDVCGFETLFEGTPFSGGVIPDQHLYATYGSGQFAIGPMGYETVSLAGITVARQEMSVANIVAFPGASNASGLIGLAYPSITSAHVGNKAVIGQDNSTNLRPYNNLFANIFQGELTAPMFSLALQRRTGGVFALGGLPDVPVMPEFSSTPILIVDVTKSGDPLLSSLFSFYTIVADDYVVGPSNPLVISNSSSSLKSTRNVKVSDSKWTRLAKGHGRRDTSNNITTDFPVIVDSGTTLTTLPASLVQVLYSQFEVEPAVIPASSGYYVVPCNIKAPAFGVTIGGQTFYMSPEDLIINDQALHGGDLGGNCAVGVQPASSDNGPFILGATWMNNVLAVFDIGAAQMRFAPRIPYSVQ